jgi:Tol biopolymer transport system component
MRLSNRLPTLALRSLLCAVALAGVLVGRVPFAGAAGATGVPGTAGAAGAVGTRSFAQVDGKLAFASTRQGPNDWAIYTRRPSGGHPVRISGPRWTSTTPSWSPDGSLIAYARSVSGGDDQIVVANPVGRDVRVLVDGEATGILSLDSPTWSPDGASLAFTGFDPVLGPQIYRVNVDGTGLDELTDLPSYAAPEGLAWSPAGSLLAFDAWSSADEDAVSDIFLMNADGTDLRHFTDDRILDFDPAFSADGSAIIWSRNDRQIVEEGIDGTGFHVILSGGGFNGFPASAPGGDWIAFVGNRPACPGCGPSYNVFLMTATGGDIHPVTHTVGVQYLSPTWRRSARG